MSVWDSGPGVPGFSWEGMAKGTTVEGILVKPSEEGQQTDIEGNLKFYTDKATGLPDKNAPMMQGIMTLFTDYRNWEYVSEAFLEKAKAEGLEDDGLRRLFVRGSSTQPSIRKGMLDALRKAGVRGGPEVGSVTRVTFLKKTPIPGSAFKANDFEVQYSSPTPETLAKIAHLMASSSTAVFGDVEPDDDPPF